MKVSEDLSFSQIQESMDSQNNGQGISTEDNHQADAESFTQMLGDENLVQGSLGDQVIQQFTTMTNSMQQYKNKANESITTAVNSPDPKNILQMMHRVNDYSEQMIIGSRLITKLSSAADQLTKLQ